MSRQQVLLLALCLQSCGGQPPGDSGPAPVAVGTQAAEGSREPGEAPWDAVATRAEEAYANQDLESSAELYRQAAALAAAAGDQRRAGALAAQRAVSLKFLGRTDEAREVLLPTLAAARELGDQRTEGLALGNLVRVEGLAGHQQLALRYLDELAALARRLDDPRLEVQTLEQAAMVALDLGQPEQALARLDTAIQVNQRNQGEDDRGEALIRQRALVSARRRDDQGALEGWARAPDVGSSLANRALLLSEMGLHEEASRTAAQAAVLLDAGGDVRRAERDQALYVDLSEALSAGRLDDVQRQLEELLARSGGAQEDALAPFHLLEGRLHLARGQAAEAASSFEEARDHWADDPGASMATLLAAVSRGVLGQLTRAHTLLDALPASPARALLRGWLMAQGQPTNTLATERLPALESTAEPGSLGDLTALRRACPLPLPSLAWLSLHHHLADADRLRDSGRGELAAAMVVDGARQALRWQLLELQALVRGRWPSARETAAAFRRIDDWVAGRMGDDEALIVVLADRQLSYLLLCTRQLGATTFGLPPGPELAIPAQQLAAALKTGDTSAVARAGWQLHRVLFGPRALEDLAGHERWALMLPEALAAVPPALLVSSEPSPGEPVAWQVLTHSLRLLPHAPLFDAGESSRSGQPGVQRTQPAAPATGGARQGWARFGEPVVTSPAEAFVLARLEQHYGAAALVADRLRPLAASTAGAAGVQPALSPTGGSGAALTVSGAEATASSLRELSGRVSALELSVPALGGGRLGGLVLSPDPGADYGDERAGFLPWHRLADLDLPPLLVLDRARYDPAERDHGVDYAGACVLAGGAHWLASTRWPMVAPIRESLLAALAEEIRGGVPPDVALASLQRGFVQSAQRVSRSDLANPRTWGPLFILGGP